MNSILFSSLFAHCLAQLVGCEVGEVKESSLLWACPNCRRQGTHRVPRCSSVQAWHSALIWSTRNRGRYLISLVITKDMHARDTKRTGAPSVFDVSRCDSVQDTAHIIETLRWKWMVVKGSQIYAVAKHSPPFTSIHFALRTYWGVVSPCAVRLCSFLFFLFFCFLLFVVLFSLLLLFISFFCCLSGTNLLTRD